ncbi:NAD-dependent epimerase/dehydratase family protein [Flavihumibacter sp. R14]|nr:NAD-dependent epimerase/dehydratase family protein [Flavihumibacter soli]
MQAPSPHNNTVPGPVFITGASGFIGRHLAIALADQGSRVHALVRRSSTTDQLNHPNITLFNGDLLDKKSIALAMTNCRQVYHLAGLAKGWMPDSDSYHNVNVVGTRNVLEAAKHIGVEKILITSTAGVFPPADQVPVDERSSKRPDLYTRYEQTKNEAEELARTYFNDGLPVVIVNPTKVYGPGLIDDSNTATMMIRDYILGKWKFIPGDGHGIANYVFIDDVVSGMISAMLLAKPGSQYIMGGDNASFNTFFSIIKKQSKINNRLFHIPYGLIRAMAFVEDIKASLKVKPFITSEWAKKIPYNWSKDISLAKTQLNYNPISLEEGVARTIKWLRASDMI